MKGDVKIGPDYLTRCRLCLSQESAKIDIFHEEGSKRDIFQKILNCLSLIVSQDDYLPKSVCHECVNLLDNFQEFRDSCHESENILNAYISSTEGQQNFEKLPEIPDTSYHREPENDAWKVRISPCPSSKEKSLIYETDPLGKVKSSDNECSGTGELEESWAGDFNTRNEQTVDSPSISASAMIEVSEQISMQQSEDNVYDSDHDNMGDLDSDEDIQIIEEYSDDNARQSSQDNVRSTTNAQRKNGSMVEGHKKGGENDGCDDHEKTDTQNTAMPASEYQTVFPSAQKMGIIVNDKFLPIQNMNSWQNELFVNVNSSNWKDSIQLLYMCNTCGAVYPDAQDLAKHTRSHNPKKKKFMCHICKKILGSKNAAYVHEKVHQGKPYGCPYCNKKFRWKADRNDHIMIHTGEMPFQCPVCSKKFRHRQGIMRHLKCTHPSEFLALPNWDPKVLLCPK